jgi:hypothetical protein
MHISRVVVASLICALSGASRGEATKATESIYEKDISKAYTSDGLTKADLAWHAKNTYGWRCNEVVAAGELVRDGYYVITCSNGTKLRVYPRSGKHPQIMNMQGTYK